MSPWKRLLLNLYYCGSYPLRVRCVRQEALQGHARMIALYYHRIADDEANAWTTSNGMFARQIDWLAKRFRFISLEELQRRVRSGRNDEPCVSITFDDGYAENFDHAIPLLLKKSIPFTYFVTLHNVLTGEPFSHDVVMGKHFAPNSVQQLRTMAAAGIEIGAHAYTHVDLAQVGNPCELQRQVVEAGQELQKAVDRPVRYFAFPYGLQKHLSPAAFELARQAGYEGVCSAYGGFNYPGDDVFHVQRIPVDDNMIRLKNRVTMDPRNIRATRFQYQGQTEGQGVASCPEVLATP